MVSILSHNYSYLLFSLYMYPVISLTFPLFVSFVYVYHRGIPYGLAVRIPGFHPGGPGSTPGMGITLYFFWFFQLVHNLVNFLS